MKKDQSIHKLLERLSLELTDGFEVADFWEADLCAIGIMGGSSNNRLVYISTFNQPSGRYSYECEIADREESIEKGDYRIVQKGRAAFTTLVKIIKDHLYG
jgi:hypothetical protein